MNSNAPWGFDDYLDADYEIRVRAKGGGRFLFFIPELGLQHVASDLTEALPELKRQQQAHLRRYADENLLHWVLKPGQMPPPDEAKGPGLARTLLPFAIKAVVVTVLFLGAVNIIGAGLGKVGRGVESGIDGIVRWSPEKVEDMRLRMATIAKKLGPAAREFSGMFDRTGQSAEPTEKP